MSLEDEIGHIFLVDIRLDHKKGDAKKWMHNELYVLIFKKQKTLDPNEKMEFQLFENLGIWGKTSEMFKFKVTKQKSTRQFSIKLISQFLKHISFLIKCTGWKVTKTHSHFTFGQEKFKKDYILLMEKTGYKRFCKKTLF